MTEEQKKAFEALTNRRRSINEALEDPAVAGIKEYFVDMYAGKAHFVYELLQNADDANATEAWFDLSRERLVFRHNGNPFTVTMPPDETGNVNAITAFGNSNKTGNTNKIGKFGLGFKAVFKYSDTPVIYDRDFCFRIEKRIIPELVEPIPPEFESDRSSGQTAFEFPFNANVIETAASDIETKLAGLVRPMLFLNSLRRIHVATATQRWNYALETEPLRADQSTSVFEKVICEKATNDAVEQEHFLKASRNLEKGLSCSVAFAMSGDWEKPIPCPGPVYCFFPTRDDYWLKFLVHAPFLVTINRGNLQENNDHNSHLINALGHLAAESIVFLRDWGIKRGIPIIDDTIFNVVPTDKSRFFDFDKWHKCWTRPYMFAPIFVLIQSCLKERGLLSSSESEPLANRYVVGASAYWAESAEILQLFDNSLLAELIGAPGAKWVFTTSGRPVANSYPGSYSPRDYKDDLIAKHFSIEDILDKLSLSPGFLSARPREWLERLYLFIQDNYSSTKQLKAVQSKAIFLGKDGAFHPATALDAAGKPQPSLFLPSKEAAFESATILEPSLLEKPELVKFFKETLHLQEPSIRDEVFNVILPKYQSETPVEHPVEDMKLMFRAWREGSGQDREEIENAMKNTPCLLADDGKWLRYPSSIYLPLEDLHLWFEGCDVHFLAKDKYQDTIAESDFSELVRFFEKLGVRSAPKTIKRRETEQERAILKKDEERFPPSSPSSGFGRCWVITSIEGLEEVLHRTIQTRDPRLSVLLWNTMQRFFVNRSATSLSSLFEAHYEWYRYTQKTRPFPSPILDRLKNTEWLLSRDGNWTAPGHTHVRDIQDRYDVSIPASKVLIEGLGISTAAPGMTVEQEAKLRKYDELMRRATEAGLSEEEYTAVVNAAIMQHARNRNVKEPCDNSENPSVPPGTPIAATPSPFLLPTNGPGSESIPGESTATMPPPPRRTPKILQGTLETADSSVISRPAAPVKAPVAEKTVDEKLAMLEQETEEKKQAIVAEQELQTSLHDLPPSSFGWFVKALEYGNRGSRNRSGPKASISIAFGRVERDESAERTIVLSLPTRDIPAQLAELDDIRIDMQQGDSSRTFRAVGASIDSDRLVVLLSREEKIDGYDFSSVGIATISVSDPDFLLQRLEERFKELHKADEALFHPDDDITHPLPPNDRVKFVFGPPGTGKTEQLAKMLLFRMSSGNAGKILVLAPTNKAADVLTLRILELARKDPSMPPTDWLVRFGGTMDETLQRDERVYREKNVDVSTFAKLVLVTTVARYPYDTTRPNKGTGRPLREEEWTEVFLDEASMIELPYAVYLMLQQPKASFVVAGDPKQLPPVTQNEYLENKNVYTFFGIDSFELQRTPVGDYEIQRLDIQHRSVPAIGDVFSRFAYNGRLQHDKTVDSIRSLGLESRMAAGPVNIIRFPFDLEHENIYRPRAVGSSAFHVYSALFAAEFALFLDGIVSVKEGEETPSIGIVSPYKVQADMISRIVEHRLAERPARCKIVVGTVHKFQGDQCTVMIVCLNPPGHASGRSLVNRESLLNVAVSRASDYLFLLVPDKNTPGLGQLNCMKRLEACAASGSGAISFKSNEMECEMFGTDNPQWLADNTFITGHMDVNVYDRPVKRYEVRFGEYAVDVQMTKEK